VWRVDHYQQRRQSALAHVTASLFATRGQEKRASAAATSSRKTFDERGNVSVHRSLTALGIFAGASRSGSAAVCLMIEREVMPIAV